MSAGYSDPIDVTFEGYAGPRRYRVAHPQHGALLIAAPDETAALVAAANHWGKRWQKWEFCTGCTISRSK